MTSERGRRELAQTLDARSGVRPAVLLERTTGFEPATLTLAR